MITIPSFNHPFTYSLLHSFTPSLLHSFILPSIHSSIPPFLHSFTHSLIHSFVPPSSSCAIRSASRPGVAINTFTFCLKRYFYPSYQISISIKSFPTITSPYLLFTTFSTNQQGCSNTLHICGKLFGDFFDLNS